MSENSPGLDPDNPDDADLAEAHLRKDPEAPEADALDQAREVAPGERLGRVSRAIDAPDADAIEQAMEVPLDADEDR
jgi:hypothetical protein